MDADSEDATQDIIRDYGVKLYSISDNFYCGANRNFGVKKSNGDVIAFLDADTQIVDGWLDELISSMRGYDIVAGYSPDPDGKHLPRVPIYVDGQDITYPTCNIAYRREVFDKVGYFREDMKRGSDCEFNYRCVKAGYIIGYNPKMKVYHHQKDSFRGFAKQAFWNGYARKQLNRIHPDLKHRHQHGVSLKNLARLGFGFLGYVSGNKI